MATLLIIGSLDVGKTKHADAVSDTKSICGNTIEDIQKIGKSILKILNEFLNTSGEASFSPRVHRNSLDTFIHQKKNISTTDNR